MEVLSMKLKIMISQKPENAVVEEYKDSIRSMDSYRA
jgi:hypothetical protein